MKNNSRLISILTICIAATAALALSVYGAIGTKRADAQSSGANVYGWAWTSTSTGWISFNCSNTGTCTGPGGVPYGVNINETTGAITGYAWSNTLGWISFNETLGCPTTCGAYVDGVSPSTMTGYKAVKGWARALAGGTAGSGGWGGWIKLDHDRANPVTYSFEDRVFKGYAWGGPLVLGWISFNSTDTGSAFAYSVRGPGLSTIALNPIGPVYATESCDAAGNPYLKVWTDANGNNGSDVVYTVYPVSATGVIGAPVFASLIGGTQIVYKDFSALPGVSRRYAIYASTATPPASVSTATSSLLGLRAGFTCGDDPNAGSVFVDKVFTLNPTIVTPPATCTGTWNVTHDGDPAEVTATCFIKSNKNAPSPVVLSGSAPLDVGTHVLSCDLRNIAAPDVIYKTFSIMRRCLRNAELIER